MMNATLLPLTRNANYKILPMALSRWSRERLKLTLMGDGRIQAVFRLEGSTCGNRALVLEYTVFLSSADQGYTILEMKCAPAAGDEGHKAMCSYLESAERLYSTLGSEKPYLGLPLDVVLQWKPKTLPAGCVCSQPSRDHKWLAVLLTIHFTLAMTNSTELFKRN
jgi:hypothetical protein